ncbi:response regulator [Deinococcus fonticola]|uniref:response regulator n=1 Tax=Deinococcus fonticola TaxID=2528713 RepID=UPI00107546AA|nr:response regulator [Deinococcus fonticola]
MTGAHVTGRPLHLLLADDSPADLLLVEMALEASGLTYTLHAALDGADALQTLQDQLNAGTLPDYLLLDLNMPHLDGFEVLTRLQAAPALAVLPVIVLSTSGARHDRQRAQTLGAKAFLTKPLNFADLVGLLQQLHAHWQGQAELPGEWA